MSESEVAEASEDAIGAVEKIRALLSENTGEQRNDSWGAILKATEAAYGAVLEVQARLAALEEQKREQRRSERIYVASRLLGARPSWTAALVVSETDALLAEIDRTAK